MREVKVSALQTSEKKNNSLILFGNPRNADMQKSYLDYVISRMTGYWLAAELDLKFIHFESLCSGDGFSLWKDFGTVSFHKSADILVSVNFPLTGGVIIISQHQLQCKFSNFIRWLKLHKIHLR